MSEQLPRHSNDLHTGETIRTFQGHYINVFDPDPDTIDIIDIAHGLSHVCRFAGHTHRFYSVAQHSIFVSLHQDISKDLQLTALLHDATEAYLCDIPRPIKRHLKEYKAVEEHLMEEISKKFGLIYPFPSEIKTADNAALDWEHKYIIVERAETVCFLSITEAKNKFLEIFNSLQ